MYVVINSLKKIICTSYSMYVTYKRSKEWHKFVSSVQVISMQIVKKFLKNKYYKFSNLGAVHSTTDHYDLQRC